MKIINLLIILFTINSCSNRKTSIQNQLTKIDTIWIDFVYAFEKNDLDYLIKNSTNTILCTDCQIDNSESEIYDAKFIFKKHLAKIKHLKTLSNKNFSSSNLQANNKIYITYQVNSKNVPNAKGYSLIFVLKKEKEKFLFNGMIVQ